MAGENKKYIFSDGNKTVSGTVVRRIISVRDFGGVRAGEAGGFLEGEKNLSHEGCCWVGGDAVVYENAAVKDDAIVAGRARIYGEAKIVGRARVAGDSWLYGTIEVYWNMS